MTGHPERVLEAIRHRRSFKPKFLKPDPVDRPLIEAVLEAARWAPSHGQTEPWHFTVYAGESRHALGEAFGEAYRIEAQRQGNYTQEGHAAARRRGVEAPVWIALHLKPALRPDGTPAMPEQEEQLALACAVQNLHLMAAALGLGGMWGTGMLAMHPRVDAFVEAPQPSTLMGFFLLGWPNIDWPAARRRPLAESVTWKTP